MKSLLKIESGVGLQQFQAFGNREIKIDRFTNQFFLTRVYVEDTKLYNYAVMEGDSRTILATARSIHYVLREFYRFLEPMEQEDLNDFINHHLE